MTTDILMIRPNLENIPEFSLPSDIALRRAVPGDHVHWTRIQRAADEYNDFDDETYFRVFGRDPAAHAARIAFLLAPDGTPIGTAAAWVGAPPRDDPAWGRVHWVAILPGWQGRGLSRPLMSIILGRLRDLGHTRAYLTTALERPVAIHLYEQFGFRRSPAGK